MLSQSKISKEELSLSRIVNTSILLRKERQNESLTYRKPLEHFKDLSLPELRSYRQKNSFSGLQNFFLTGLEAKTIEENKTMREKLTEYSSLSGSQNIFDEELNDINDEDIYRKLKEQGVKLNLLIAKKGRIRTISPYNEERVLITKDNQFYGRIRCKGMPLALIVTVIIKQGVGSSYLYLSFTTERPDYKSYDKVVSLNKSRMTITFTEKQAKSHTFSKEWIYFALESEREGRMTFECSFGRGKVLVFIVVDLGKQKDNEQEGAKSARGGLNIKDIELMINEIVSDPLKLRKCQEEAKEVMKKRELNGLRSPRQLYKIMLEKSLLKPKPKIPSIVLNQEKWKKIEQIRLRLTNNMTMRKFVLSHKQKILKQFVIFLLNDRAKYLPLRNQCLRSLQMQ